MDTTYSTNRKLIRMFANILSIFVILAMAFPATGSVSAQEPAPFVRISTSNDYLQADNFTPNTLVTFTAYASQGSSDVVLEISRQTDETGLVFIDGWEHTADLVAGNYVVATDGNLEKRLVLQPLTMEVFDPVTDLITGTATPGQSVWVLVGNNIIGYPGGMWVVTDNNGLWTADFSSVFNFTDEMWGGAVIYDDDSDFTVYHLGPPPPPPSPNPHFQVQLETNHVDGWEWTPNSQVTITINGAEPVTVPTDEWGTFRSHFGDLEPFVPGMEFVITDGVSIKTLTTAYLEITNVDPDTETVSGKANAGQTFNVWVHGPENAPTVQVTADEMDEWTADFSEKWNIVPGSDGAAQIDDEDGDGTWVPWRLPKPRFTVFPEWEFFDGNDWPNGATVTITVAGKPECETTKQSWGYFFNGNFGEGCNVEFGDVVTFTDGTTTRTHIVQKLYVTDVDMAANTVSGKADAGVTVFVWPHDGWFEPLQATANELGEWQVDLDDAGYTIRDDSAGRSEIRDAMGNATASDWHVLHPRMVVFPEWEWFDGNDWPNEALVTITVAGKPQCETTKESWNYFFNGNFGEGCDIVFGDVVTFTDGETIRTHTVRNLAITKVNQDDDLVKGTASAGAEVHVWPHATGQEQIVIANPKGKWDVDFTGIYDLMPGDGGRSEIRDEMGNSTAVDWNIPNPRLIAFPAVDQIFGYGWPYGSRVNLNINGKHIAGTYVQGAPWDPNDIMAFFDFGGLHDLVAGDVVTLSGRDMEINYTVQNLTVTEANADANTVSGTSDPSETVYVWQHEPGPQLPFEANGDGEWLADLNGYYDIYPGSSGRSEIRDEFGNATAVDWRSPNTRFTVWPEWNYLEGYEWPNGATVAISVADKEICSTEAIAGFPEWDPWNTFFSVNFPVGCTIEAGDLVRLSFETLDFTHQVQELTITEVNLDNNTVTGTAVFDPEQYDFHTWIHGVDGSYMQLSADGGAWLMDFDDLGIDLLPGMGGRVELTDQASNSTAIDWYIPSPNLIAFPAVDQIFGYNWPQGSEVSLTINGQYIATATVQAAPWDPNDIMALFDFGGLHNLVAGDVVTLSGSGMELTYTVQNLSVTEVDADANTVSGAADNGALLYAGVHEWWDVTEMQLTATGGTWLADFDSRNFDLQVGMCGRAEIRDESGSRTAADWCIPNSRIVASITEDWFYLQEFSPNTTLNFTVYEAQGKKPIWKGTATTDGSGFVWVNADGRWNLEPGNYLVVKDGTNTKDLIIEGFTFDVFNLTKGVLQGTVPGQEGRLVWVGIGFENDGWSMDVFTDADGNWLADFGASVPSNYWWVAAQIFDADGDASELRPALQSIFLRPRCGDTYTVQANIPLEIRYGSWLALGEELAIQNAQHLTVNLVLDGELVAGVQQPVVPGSEIPCGASDGTYGVFYVTQVPPLSAGTHVASVTWILDEQVTDGGDVDGDGVPDLYGPGEVFIYEFTIILQ